VSRKLGYEHDGIRIDPRDGEAVISARLRLTRSAWTRLDRPTATVEGLAACRPMFGLDGTL
jgi:hypothetical protein